MDKQIKERWVAALRSGEYPQGTHRFEYLGRFCCLGVLCKVMGQPTGAQGAFNALAGNWEYVDSIVPLAHSSKLATMNDTGESFLEIATWIEAKLCTAK